MAVYGIPVGEISVTSRTSIIKTRRTEPVVNRASWETVGELPDADLRYSAGLPAEGTKKTTSP